MVHRRMLQGKRNANGPRMRGTFYGREGNPEMGGQARVRLPEELWRVGCVRLCRPSGAGLEETEVDRTVTSKLFCGGHGGPSTPGLAELEQDSVIERQFDRAIRQVEYMPTAVRKVVGRERACPRPRTSHDNVHPVAIQVVRVHDLQSQG